MRPHRSVPVIAALAGLLAGAPITAATDATLPGGTSLSIDITSPADGTIVGLGASVPLSGSASVGQGSSTPNTALVYALDVSASTNTAITGGVAACDDSATGALAGSILDCEVRALLDLNDTAIAKGTVAKAGVVAFGGTAVRGDLAPSSGIQVALIAPDADANADATRDIVTVLRSAQSDGTGSPGFGLRQFAPVTTVNGRTNYQAAVQVASQAATSAGLANPIVVLVSDGDATEGSSYPSAAAVQTALDALIPDGVTVYAFAVGDLASCAPVDLEHFGTLQMVADVSGGTCTRVTDPTALPDVLPNVVGAALDGISVSVDDAPSGAPVTVSPALPAAGPSSVTWSATLSGLTLGSHEVCATATGSDSGGSDAVSECIRVIVHAVITDGPYGGGAGGDAVVEGSPAAISASVFGTASFDHWAVAPASGVDAGASCTFGNATAAATSVTCTDDGVYALTAFATNPADSFATTLTVANADPVITSATYAPSGTVLTGTAVTITAPFTDQGTNDTQGCSVDWADTAAVAGSVTGSAGDFTCTSSRTLTAPGTYTATVTVSDDDGGTDTADVTNGAGGTSITLTVVDSVISAGGPYGGSTGENGGDADTEGESLAIAAQVTAGASFDHWSFAPGAGVDAGATCSFANAAAASTTVRCTDDGVFTLTAHSTGPADAASASLTLANAAPTVGAITVTPGTLLAAGTVVSVRAPVADLGTNDSLGCSVTWDDGAAASTGTISAGACSASKALATPGVYRVIVTVTDDDGGSASRAYEYVVIYDPTGGFVTGGGWLDAKPGSYPADPTLGGKASFGFVSKYKKGATVPDGNTEFQFHAAGMRFASDTYQWLVVAGSKAQFKGTGSVDGVAGYGFLVTVTDGSVDRFRIKIWDAHDVIVFDNVLGAGDGADPQAIGGGSIVIQAKK